MTDHSRGDATGHSAAPIHRLALLYSWEVDRGQPRPRPGRLRRHPSAPLLRRRSSPATPAYNTTRFDLRVARITRSGTAPKRPRQQVVEAVAYAPHAERSIGRPQRVATEPADAPPTMAASSSISALSTASRSSTVRRRLVARRPRRSVGRNVAQSLAPYGIGHQLRRPRRGSASADSRRPAGRGSSRAPTA